MNKWKHPFIITGGIIAFVLIATAIFAPLLCSYDPNGINLHERYDSPSWQHWFGTDQLGRDVFTRVIYGTQISLGIGVTTRTAGLIIGMFIGCLSGYYGGKTDMILQRLVDITLAFPFLLLVVSIAIVFSEGLFSVFIALTAVMWASMARLMRSQVLVTKEMEYVKAAKAYGASDLRIILLHIIPNAYVPALIWWTMGLAQAIVSEAGLSFLGLGAQPPTPSWGSMINYETQAIRVAPWASLFPGLALAMTVLGFNLFGEGLRDVLDPRRSVKLPEAK
jgi:peptide/nickel transport system permease protein/oligopeptide transport system permease protein